MECNQQPKMRGGVPNLIFVEPIGCDGNVMVCEVTLKYEFLNSSPCVLCLN